MYYVGSMCVAIHLCLCYVLEHLNGHKLIKRPTCIKVICGLYVGSKEVAFDSGHKWLTSLHLYTYGPHLCLEGFVGHL